MFNFFKRKKNEEPLYNVKGIEKLQNSIYELEEQIEKEKLEKLKNPSPVEVIGDYDMTIEIAEKLKTDRWDNERDNKRDEYSVVIPWKFLRDLETKIRKLIDKFKEMEKFLNTKNLNNFEITSEIHENFNPFRDLTNRIQTLEELLNINNTVLKEKRRRKVRKGIKTVEAIIEVLEENKKELHLNDIFSMIKNKNLKNPDVSCNTVRTTLYYLLQQKKIKNGKKAMCFQIKEDKSKS